jgi:N-acyl-D-aspartate/D-glutamate deacylase
VQIHNLIVCHVVRDCVHGEIAAAQILNNRIGKLDLGLNVGSLVGYSTLRRGLLGDEMRKLESRELDILLSALDQSLQEGALGLSSGQSYVHESAVSELEIFETAKIVKHYDGLLSIHLRSEGEQLLESLEEVLEIARRSEVRMKLSHFKVYHKKNWHLHNKIRAT